MSCGPRGTKYDRYNNLAIIKPDYNIHRHRYCIGLRHKNVTTELAEIGLDHYSTIKCKLVMNFKLLKLHCMGMKVALN